MNQRVVKSRLDQCGKPEIDQFASHIIKYTSYLPDPDAYHVKAISLFWLDHNSYIFSPFSIIERVLTKLAQGQATALVTANTAIVPTICVVGESRHDTFVGISPAIPTLATRNKL